MKYSKYSKWLTIASTLLPHDCILCWCRSAKGLRLPGASWTSFVIRVILHSEGATRSGTLTTPELCTWRIHPHCAYMIRLKLTANAVVVTAMSSWLPSLLRTKGIHGFKLPSLLPTKRLKELKLPSLLRTKGIHGFKLLSLLRIKCLHELKLLSLLRAK